MVTQNTSPTQALVGDADTEAVSGEPVEFDISGWTELVETTRDSEPGMASSLEGTTERDDLNGAQPHPVSLFLWITARSQCRLSSVAQVATECGLASRSNVNPKLNELKDHGLVTVRPITDGYRGRSDKRLATCTSFADDSTIPRSVLSLLS